MDDPNLFSRYEQRENKGKVLGERKYQPKAVKDVEKKLTALGKKITELQRHRKRAYNNSVRVKKNIHHQVNQIVRSFRDRERTLLADVDESYIYQVSSIDDELEKLLTTNVCCQTLYSSLYDFRENRNVLHEINDILSTVNLDEKPEYKRLDLISSLEQAKLYANSYGNLDGEFLKKDIAVATVEDADPYTTDQEQSPNKVVHEEQTYSDIKTKFLEKNHKRERTESQDSFEIVELLENIHCHDNKDLLDEKNKSKDLLSSSVEDEFDNLTENFPASSAETLKNSSRKEYLCLEERIMKINEQLEIIVSSAPKFNTPHEKKIKPMNQIQGTEEKTGSSKSCTGYEVWLCKTTKNKNAMEIDDVENYSGANTNSPADLIKKAFSPYLANGNVESWLASKY